MRARSPKNSDLPARVVHNRRLSNNPRVVVPSAAPLATPRQPPSLHPQLVTSPPDVEAGISSVLPLVALSVRKAHALAVRSRALDALKPCVLEAPILAVV